MKIAISGKGGVGKTTVSAFLIQALVDRGRKVLAVDSDPSPHLARVLGFPDANEIIPIADMTELIQERSQRAGAFYNMNPRVDDLPDRFMRRKGDIKLMVVGAIQKGGGGCACAENTVLRNLINTLILSPNEDIVLDMEAGVEHLGRGTIASVDHLLVVVQPYRGSLETAQQIKKLSQDLGLKNLSIVANHVSDEEDLKYIEKIMDEKVLGWFPLSPGVKRAERNSVSIEDSDSAMKEAARKLLDHLEQLG